MLPKDFWALTPNELGVMLEGATWREEQEWERMAWAVAHMLNISGKSIKRPVTGAKLLGRKTPPDKVKVKDPEGDWQKLWAKHKRQHGIE